MSLETEVAALTQNTTALLDAVLTSKASLDQAVSDAEAQVALAADQVGLAEAQVALAAGQVSLAEDQVTLATNQANAAAGSVQAAEAVRTDIAANWQPKLDAADAAASTATAQAIVASTSADLAISAASVAQTAKDTAFVNANVYADTTAGLAATTNGQQFQVVSGAEVIRYSNSSGSAVELVRYPSSSVLSGFVPNQEGATSYSNTGGQGDRSASITVTASAGLVANGVLSNLVDGATGNNYTDSISMTAGASVSGATLTFDFGASARRVITEAKLLQSAANNLGTWKWQGSQDATTWVDIGSSFTLGAATSQTQTALAANTQGYRYYRLLGVSGSVPSSGLGYVQEIQFKISKSATDSLPTRTETQSLIDAAAALSAFAKTRLPSGVVSYYPCDDGSGTSLRDIIGGKTADLSNGGGTVAWTPEGWLKLTSGWFKTPSQATQTVVVLMRCPEGYTNYNFAVPNADAIGQGSYGATTATVKVLHGWGITPMIRRSSSAQGPVNQLAGGWVLVSHQIATQTTNVCAIGCGNLTGSSPASSMEVAGIAILSGTASDADLRKILNYVAESSRPRGIFLRPQDCPRQAHLAAVIGESTSEGTFLISGLSSGQRAVSSDFVLIDARNTTSASTTGRIMKRLSLDTTYANANPPNNLTKCGLEVGILNARVLKPTDGRPLHILKAAKGSTYLVPSGSYTNAAGGTTAVDPTATRNSAESEIAGQTYVLEIANMRRMEIIARNQGVGYTSVSVVYTEGLNDAYIGTGAVPNASTYQGYIQAHYDKLIALTGISGLKLIAIKPHEPAGGLGGGDPDYPNSAAGTNRLTALGYIRTAFDSFQAANSANVSLLDGNTYALNTPTDYIHPSAAGYDAMGQAAEALFAYTTFVTPVA